MTRTRGTQASTITVVASIGLLFLSSSTNDGWLVLLAGLGLGAVVAAWVLRPKLGNLEPEVSLPDRCRVGDTVDAALVVTNRGRRTSVPCTLHLHAPALSCTDVRIPALRPGESAHANTPAVTRARGAVDEVEFVLRTTAPFSLVSVRHTRSAAASLLVHPAPGRALAIPPGGDGDGHGALVAGGIEVQGVREWHPGEPTGRLYARGTAKHGRPLVLDRHDDVGDSLAIVVAGPEEKAAGTTALQEALIAVVAATLLERAGSGRDVVASTPGTQPDVSGTDATAFLDWCARLGATPTSPVTPEHVARGARAVGSGGHVVLAQLTGLDDVAALRRHADAASSAGANLLVLHRFPGRTDALGLQDARAYLATGGTTGARS